MTQLGIQAVSTASVATVKGQGSVLSNSLSPLGEHRDQAVQARFVNVPRQPAGHQPARPGPGQHRSNSALGFTSASRRHQHRRHREWHVHASTTPIALAGLSETFRPDLVGSALIDIQGTVQSIRGSTATGLVLNDTGNLNLVKFKSVTYSTIVGQPVGHIQIRERSHRHLIMSPQARRRRPKRRDDQQAPAPDRAADRSRTIDVRSSLRSLRLPATATVLRTETPGCRSAPPMIQRWTYRRVEPNRTRSIPASGATRRPRLMAQR